MRIAVEDGWGTGGTPGPGDRRRLVLGPPGAVSSVPKILIAPPGQTTQHIAIAPGLLIAAQKRANPQTQSGGTKKSELLMYVNLQIRLPSDRDLA